MLRTLAKKALATLGIDIGELRRRSAPSYKLHQFIDRDGKFDYAKYRRVQNDANMKKIDFVWVQRENVYAIADYIRARGRSPKWGLCHGTRRGNEQAWFSEALGCEVIGTDIGDSATQFPNTVQHDFHETRLEWIGKADFIYSNSFDHAYDPGKALNAWASLLNKDGMIFIEHSSGHEAYATSETDPFGAAVQIMPYLVLEWGKGRFFVTDVIDLPKRGPGIDFIKALVIECPQL